MSGSLHTEATNWCCCSLALLLSFTVSVYLGFVEVICSYYSWFLLHRLAALTQFFVPYLPYLSFQVFATSIGHVPALLNHLNLGCVLLLAAAEEGQGEAGGTALVLQKGAPCKRRQSLRVWGSEDVPVTRFGSFACSLGCRAARLSA